jgi:hypothetical protein
MDADGLKQHWLIGKSVKRDQQCCPAVVVRSGSSESVSSPRMC